MELLRGNDREVTVRFRSWHNTYLSACEDQTSVNLVFLAGNEQSTIWTLKGENPEKVARFSSIYGKHLAINVNSKEAIQSARGSKDSYTCWRLKESSKGFPHVLIGTRSAGYYVFPGVDFRVKWHYSKPLNDWLKSNIDRWVIEIVGYRAISNQQHTNTKSSPTKEILSPEMRRTTSTNITVIGQQNFYSPDARWSRGNTINTGHNTNGSGVQTVGDAINGHNGIGDLNINL